jgi:predicted Zn-dependent peptidase
VLARLQKESCGTLSPEEERARLWSDVLAQGKRRLEQSTLATGRSASRQAMRAIGRALLAGTAYEPPPAAALQAITATDLEAWHLSSRRPENAILLVVGQLDPIAGEQLVRGWFTSWRPAPASRTARVPAAAVASAPPRLFRVAEAGVDQAQVVLGCRVSSSSLAENAAHQVLARLLARDLRTRLREQLGATYGVHADLLELKMGTTMLTLETDVAREHLAGALREIVARFDGIAAQAPAAAPLRKAQLEVFRLLAGPVSTDQLALQATRLLLLGQPLEQLNQASAAAGQVSPQAVRAAAAACRRTLTVAVAGDAAALAPLSLPGFAVEDLR